MNRPTNTKRKLSRVEKRHVLARIVRDPHASNATKLRAIELDSMLAGHFAPVQVEVEIGPRTLDALLGTGAAYAENPAPLL